METWKKCFCHNLERLNRSQYSQQHQCRDQLHSASKLTDNQRLRGRWQPTQEKTETTEKPGKSEGERLDEYFTDKINWPLIIDGLEAKPKYRNT